MKVDKFTLSTIHKKCFFSLTSSYPIFKSICFFLSISGIQGLNFRRLEIITIFSNFFSSLPRQVCENYSYLFDLRPKIRLQN